MSEVISNNLDYAEIAKSVPICKVPFSFMPPMTAFGKIYLPEKLFNSYHSENPSPETRAMVAHESTHIQRLGTGTAIYIKFWTNKDFRFQEELAAIHNEMIVLKEYDKTFDIDKRAKMLSGVGYLWCTSYEEAKNKLREIWS